MKRLLILPALLAILQLQAQQIEEYRYWINDDPTGLTATGIGPAQQVVVSAALTLPTLTRDFNTITIQFKDTNDVYSVPVSSIFTRNTGDVVGYEYWIDDDIANRASGTLTAGANVNLTSNIPLCLTAGTHLFAIRFQGASGTWSVPITRQFTSAASADTDEDGICDALDPCPLLANLAPGNACDDGNASTINDMVDNDCQCIGTPLENDCEGTPGGPAQPGTACNDNDACTVNDVYDANCNCAGTFQDSDNDGVCDADDSCPNVTGQIGSACNDGNPNTENDMLDASCTCIGTPVGGGCQFNDASLEIETDGVSTTLWEVRMQGTDALVASGGQLYPEGFFNESICLPDGCYYLVVTDDGGDGISGGGYVLRDPASRRIIDNAGNFTSGSISQIANGLGFCLPMGTDRLISSSCDKYDWTPTDYVVANDNPAVTAQYGVSNATSGYQLWWYNPNGGYSFRRYQSHSTSNGLAASATRACHFRVNGWSGNQLQENVLYNVRVRSRVAGVFNEFGPACRFILNPLRAQCPLTQLLNDPGNPYFSCGATREWGAGNYVHASPVSGANRYQFRFRIPDEGFSVTRTVSSYFVQLNWATLPLEAGKTYQVDVRVSKNGGATWCSDFIQPSLDPWGPVCSLTIAGEAMNSLNMAHEGTEPARSAQLSMYPNPNRGDHLFINLSQVEEGVNTVSVDIYDGFGKRVAARTIAVTDGYLNTVLELNGELATGMYLANISAGGTVHTERLVIQP